MADSKLSSFTETSVVDLDDVLYTVDVSDPTDDATGSSRKISARRLLALLNNVCQFRLTTESGVPVSASDRTAQSTLYLTPYKGNKIALHDGTRWVLRASVEVSLALAGLTAGKNYDVFAYDNAGTVALELSAAWTDDTTRADALTTQDGVYVKSGGATRRYVGTIRTTGTTTTEDGAANRFVWNAQHRVFRPFRSDLGNTNWTCSATAFREVQGSSAYRRELVCGLAGDTLELAWSAFVGASSGTPNYRMAWGEDGTTIGLVANGFLTGGVNVASGYSTPVATLRRQPSVGLHYFTPLERVQSGLGTADVYAGLSPDGGTGIWGGWPC